MKLLWACVYVCGLSAACHLKRRGCNSTFAYTSKTKHGGQQKAVETIHASILSQLVQRADGRCSWQERDFISLILLETCMHSLVFSFFFCFLLLLVWLESWVLYSVIYAEIIDDSQNTGHFWTTVCWNCHGEFVPQQKNTKVLDGLQYVASSVALFVFYADLLLVTVKILSILIDVYKARGARQ